jgi:hypothetical protein
MIQIYLKSILCNVETNEVGADEPYVLITAVNLASGGLAPAFEVVRYGPFQDVDQGETHSAPGISNSFWGVNKSPATITDPNDVIFVVSLMENDDGNAENLRGIVKGLVAGSLLASSTFSYHDKVSNLINDINSALGTITGSPNFDDKIGSSQALRFTLNELNQAEAGQTIQKNLNFFGDGGSYTLRFEARNPVPLSGDLLWHKHTGWESGNNNWENNGDGIKVRNGFQNFKSVFATSDGIIYAIRSNGDLLWFKHLDWQSLGNNNWAINSGVKVGNGWQNFKLVFATSNGVIYGIQNDGNLLWYKHNGWVNGTNSWAIGSGKSVGNSWHNFKSVFATSIGVIYAIQPNGDLLWYKHNGWTTGTKSWATGSGKKIGDTWQNHKSVFATSNGVIYAVQSNGDLLWFRHPGWQQGVVGWQSIHGVKVESGWQNFKSFFAMSRIPLLSGALGHFMPECVIYAIQP